jgi:hypothetical protein
VQGGADFLACRHTHQKVMMVALIIIIIQLLTAFHVCDVFLWGWGVSVNFGTPL